MKEKTKELEDLRRKIIKEVFIERWKDVWFYPEHNGIKGWLGTQNIMFVGSNPSYNTFPTKYTDFFYDQLKKNGFKNAHLTDLIKIRAPGRKADQVIRDNWDKQKEFFQKEIKIIKPILIVIMGNRCEEALKRFKYQDERFVKVYHYSSIMFPKNEAKFTKQMRGIKERYLRS